MKSPSYEARKKALSAMRSSADHEMTGKLPHKGTGEPPAQDEPDEDDKPLFSLHMEMAHPDDGMDDMMADEPSETEEDKPKSHMHKRLMALLHSKIKKGK